MTTSSDPPPRHPSQPDVDGSWSEWKRAVLRDLDETKRDVEGLTRDVGKLRTEIAVLHTKVTLYAAGAGALTSVVVAVAVELLTKLVGK